MFFSLAAIRVTMKLVFFLVYRVYNKYFLQVTVALINDGANSDYPLTGRPMQLLPYQASGIGLILSVFLPPFHSFMMFVIRISESMTGEQSCVIIKVYYWLLIMYAEVLVSVYLRIWV